MNEAPRKIWVHDLSPFLVRFSSNTGISWYGLSYLAGFLAAGFVIFAIVRRRSGPNGLRPELVPDFVAWTAIGALVGGRLGYALLYAPELLSGFSRQAPYWDLFKVWEGGMASHGGIFGVFLATVIYARVKKLATWRLLDLAALASPIGIFFGRLANFANGELFGREAPNTSPFAMKFPREMQLWLERDPRQLLRLNNAIEALGKSDDFANWRAWLTQLTDPSVPIPLKHDLRARLHEIISRMIRVIQDGGNSIRDSLGEVLTPRYPSQLIEAGLEGLAVLCLVLWFARRERAPGTIASFWLFTYSLARIAAEVFREPDAQIGFDPWGLTRGQWLSIATLALATCLILYLKRSATRRRQSQELRT